MRKKAMSGQSLSIPIAKPAKPPVQITKEIELPDIKRNKKTTKKQENRIQLLKLNIYIYIYMQTKGVVIRVLRFPGGAQYI
jgi:hypothetical protein